MQVTVEIPDRFLEHLVPPGQDAARTLLEEAVAGAYRDHRLTMEQARQLLGFGTRMQVDAFLQRHEIFDYTVSLRMGGGPAGVARKNRSRGAGRQLAG